MITITIKLVAIILLITLALESDLRTYKIKNTVTYSFMLAGMILNLLSEGPRGFILSLLGIVLPLICLFALYALRFIGAGDIKLLGAVGAIMGASFALYAAAFSFICGGLMAIAIIIKGKNGMERLGYLLEYIKSCLLSGKLLKYTDFNHKNGNGEFHFSIAVASGTAAAYALFIYMPVV